MARRNDKYGLPFSMRLSPEERARLDVLAGDMPIAAYMRSRLFDTPSPRHHKMRRYDVNQSLLKKLLRELGRQHISCRLHRIMNAIDDGEVEMDDKLELELRYLCSELRHLRRNIRKALGDELSDRQWGGRR
ncbi:MAG: hypothetical protein OJI67_17775 [Prosthecobacter sp.]|nr:hypothetical protein [Prosthecobacter sp.]